MEPKKLTKQEFADKYGYDPRTRTSTKAPTQGAVGGSNTMSAKELLAQMRSGSTTTGTPMAQTTGGTASDLLAQMRSTTATSPSGYKPGKFIQALEDVRPDYSGGTLSDISAGLGDVGVGVVKGAVRMPVNILQAITPDKMWGENSLLNSDSERARAFESATKGKTGLQKLGATGVDVASLVTPVGAEKGALTLSQLAGKGAGNLASKLVGSNTGMLAKGITKLAPIVGESVAGTAMLGGNAGDVGLDVGIGLLSPVASRVLKGIRNVKISPATRMAIGEVVGSSKMADKVIEDAAKIVNENGPEIQKSFENGRKIMGEIVTPAQIGNIFGAKNGLVTEDAMQRFNEVSDVIMHSYLPDLGPGGRFDWSKANTKLATDIDLFKRALDTGESKIGNIPVNTSNMLKNTESIMGSSFRNKNKPRVNKALANLSSVINDFLNTSGLGTNASRSKGILPLSNVDALKQEISILSRAAEDAGDRVSQKVYVSALESIDKINESSAKTAGFKDAYDKYRQAKDGYSFLKNVEDVMRVVRNSKNPEATKQLTTHIVGLISGAQFGPLAYYPARILTKIFGDSMAKRAITGLKSDPIRQGLAMKRDVANQAIVNDLKNAVSSNKYSNMVINKMKRGPKDTKTRSKLVETIAKQSKK